MRIIIFLQCIVLFLLLILLFVVGFRFSEMAREPYINYATSFNILCTSNSMYPTIQCGDRVLAIPFDGNVTLGSIYVFNAYWHNTTSVTHRAIECLDLECNKIVFRGDNNAFRDPYVNISDVLYEVIAVEYGKKYNYSQSGIFWFE